MKIADVHYTFNVIKMFPAWMGCNKNVVYKYTFTTGKYISSSCLCKSRMRLTLTGGHDLDWIGFTSKSRLNQLQYNGLVWFDFDKSHEEN